MKLGYKLKGYTVISSLSHGLLGPMKQALDILQHRFGSTVGHVGNIHLVAGFPDPEKAVLVFGCMKEAIYDKELGRDDKIYRDLFGDRVMLEVQAYLKKVPVEQISFRTDPNKAGHAEDMRSRIIQVFESMGLDLSEKDRTGIKGYIN
jgi:hypothetical protein